MLHAYCNFVAFMVLCLRCTKSTTKGVLQIGLSAIRRKKGISQAKLSEMSGVHRVTIARFETGKISPKLKTLERLAAALGVPVGKIID